MRHSRVAGRMALWAGRILSLLVPPVCVVCERRIAPDRRWLCDSCRMALALEARSMRRMVDLGGSGELEVRYCFPYASTVSGIVAEMKYGDKPGLAGLLVPFLGLALGDRAGGETAVVPVPIHASKLRARGYNQSRLLAEGLARSRGFHLLDMLVKTKVTASQTSLERDSRVKNVVGSISARGAAAFYVERALLVDDVVTTGSTLRECARAMAAAGIKEISACAVAASL